MSARCGAWGTSSMKHDKSTVPKPLWQKLFARFALFAVLVLGLLWLLQTVFFQTFYDGMMIWRTKRAAASLAEDCTPEAVDALAREQSLFVLVTDADGAILHSADEYKEEYEERHESYAHTGGGEDENPYDHGIEQWRIGSYRNLPENWSAFRTALRESETGTTELRGDSLYVWGTTVRYEGADAILYVSTPLRAVGGAVAVLRIQLLAVTALSLILAFVLAAFLARSFSRPVAKLSRTAEKLGGDDPVRFETGFSSELDTLARTLNEAGEKLAEAKAYQQELLANVSHDLRTPLTMIRGYAEMLEDDEDPVQRKADAAVIERESDRLAALVNEILEYSELTSLDRLPKERADLSALVSSAARNYAGVYAREGGVVRCEIGEDIYVNGNAARLERVAGNLIDNAIRHAGEDKTVLVRLTRESGKAVLTVEDHGAGIPPEDLTHIWERYYTNRQRGGKGVSGLGLAIVKQIVTLHGGKVSAQSLVGEGSRFIVSLPEED